jgi:hypothetical protein
MNRRDVFNILEDLGRGINDLKSALEPLAKAFGKAATRAATPSPKTRRTARRLGKKAARQMSASVKQLRALQGRYMAFLKKLSKAQQAQVKNLRKSKGYRDAIKLASALSAKLKS